MTSIKKPRESFFERADAANVAAYHIVRRDRRDVLVSMGFWLNNLKDDFPHRINPGALEVIDTLLNERLGGKLEEYSHPHTGDHRHKTRFEMLVRYVGNDFERYEWAVTLLGVLGFSTDGYPEG